MVIGMILLLALFGGINYYVGKRLFQCVRYVLPQLPKMILVIFLTLSTLLLIFAFARSFMPLPDSVKSAVGAVSVCWMGIFIYLFLFVLLSDAVLLLGRLVRLVPTKMLHKARFAAVCAAVACTLVTTVWGFYNASQLRHVRYDITLSDKTPDKMHIVLISDLHLGAVGSEARLEKLVTQINDLRPDVVCVAGDVFDNDYCAIDDPDRARQLLSSLQSTYGVYATLGNHDAGQTVPDMLKLLEDSGIHALHDEHVVIDDRFVLVGRLDGTPIGGASGFRRADTKAVMENVPKDLPVIVMDHNPANIGQYGAETDLIVCGHTHKGQLFPGSIITGLMYAVDYGYYQKDAESPQVVVTSGAGTWGMPMRVGTQCEVVSIWVS